MNQNTYTIRVVKTRALTILPQMRDLFPRHVMAANANDEHIPMDNVTDTIIKKIVRETSVHVKCNDGGWIFIPVRSTEHDINEALKSASMEYESKADEVEKIIDQVEDDATDTIVEEPVVETPTVEENEPELVEEQPRVEEEEVPPVIDTEVLAAKTEIPETPISEIGYKSVPRNNNRNNGKYNNKK